MLSAGDSDAQADEGGIPVAVAEAIEEAGDTFGGIRDFLLGSGGRILLIVFLALVLHIVVRRSITRFTRRISEADAAERWTKWRTRAPSVVARSSVFAERSAARAQTLAQVLRSIATAIVWTMATVMVLGEIGVNLGPLIAGAGIAGVALGFGAQSLVKDFLTGFFMLVEDQCGVGDIVDVGEAIGTVESVSLRVTKVRDVSGTLWHVPNGQIERVANFSQEWARALLDVPVPYNLSPAEAMTFIKGAADEMWRDAEWNRYILAEPEVWGVQDFGQHALIIRLVVQTEPAEQWRVARELRRRLWSAFDDHGIQVPLQNAVLLKDPPEGRPPSSAAVPPPRA